MQKIPAQSHTVQLHIYIKFLEPWEQELNETDQPYIFNCVAVTKYNQNNPPEMMGSEYLGIFPAQINLPEVDSVSLQLKGLREQERRVKEDLAIRLRIIESKRQELLSLAHEGEPE